MSNTTKEYLNGFFLLRRGVRRARGLFSVLALVVVCFVFWQFRLDGITMTDDVLCGLEEHTHTDACYAQVLSCTEEHEHTGECCCRTLICDLPEHMHTVECLSDKKADVEKEDDYIENLPEPTGNVAEDLALIAESQTGYRESEENFVLDENGERRGYTRFGDWYGNPYGNWQGMFVSFCLYYADVTENDFPYGSGCQSWVYELNNKGLICCDCDILRGDIIFICDEDGNVAETGIVTKADASYVSVIKGDCNNEVQCVEYKADDVRLYAVARPGKSVEKACSAEETQVLSSGSLNEPAAVRNTAVPASTTDGETELSVSVSENIYPETVMNDAEPKALTSSQNGISEGSHGSCTFSINRVKNAFATEDKYAAYRNDTDLGLAGCFHIVAFNYLKLQSHCNGNILAKEMETSSNFGTNNMTNELTYIQEYTSVNGNSASNNNHVLALGSTATLTLTDNGNSIAVNGTKIDKPKNIIQDESAAVPLIDMTALRTELLNLSNVLSQQSTAGVSASFNDQNNRNITITSAGGLAFYNITGATLSSYQNNPLRMKGFSSSDNGTLVINVNCQGCTSITIPEATIYIDGQEQQTSETTDFKAGRILWNFYNASGCEITAKRMSGSVLAIGATVKSTSNLNGSIFADDIYIMGESHRTDFIGSLGNFALSIGKSAPVIEAEIQVNDEPAGSEEFKFKAEKIQNGQWVTAQTVLQNGGKAEFETDAPDETVWYCISQIPDTVSGNYTYDSSFWLVKVESDSTVSYYRPTDGNTTKSQIITGSGVNTSLLTALPDGEKPVFNNLKNPYVLPATGSGGTHIICLIGVCFVSVGVFGIFDEVKKRREADSVAA